MNHTEHFSKLDLFRQRYKQQSSFLENNNKNLLETYRSGRGSSNSSESKFERNIA